MKPMNKTILCLILVFVISLVAGYYFGKAVADKKTDEKKFTGDIFGGGAMENI